MTIKENDVVLIKDINSELGGKWAIVDFVIDEVLIVFVGNIYTSITIDEIEVVYKEQQQAKQAGKE